MKNKKQKPVSEKETTIDMPEINDIPGQEHVKPPRMREMMDTTASSADEEGEGLLDDLNKEPGIDEHIDNSGDISAEEKRLLAQTDRPETDEDRDLKKMALDKIDEEDGTNEKRNPLDMGKDLDVPGSELDDEDEEEGEEDEENNSYSQPD
jgi:hypothetical protein